MRILYRPHIWTIEVGKNEIDMENASVGMPNELRSKNKEVIYATNGLYHDPEATIINGNNARGERIETSTLRASHNLSNLGNRPSHFDLQRKLSLQALDILVLQERDCLVQ